MIRVVKILEIYNQSFLGETKDNEQIIFYYENDTILNIGDVVEIVCEDLMTLSLPPQQKAISIKKKGARQMIFNLKDLQVQFMGKFTKQDLIELEALEKQLQFPSFNTDDALKLGNILYNKAKPRGAVAIRITRESDALPIFQIVMEPKTQRHLDFGEAKRKTVLRTHHCSMWPLVKQTVDGGLDDLFEQESPCLCGSGGFPIIVNGQLVATIFVSGLHEGQDQLVLVEAISEFLGVDTPEYHGFIF